MPFDAITSVAVTIESSTTTLSPCMLSFTFSPSSVAIAELSRAASTAAAPFTALLST